MEQFSHCPVLLDEVIEALAIRPCGLYVDGTMGGAGHSSEIAARLDDGRLFAIDQDENALLAGGARLAPFGSRARVLRGNFADMGALLQSEGVTRVDGILLDLGVSSHQLDEPQRGFSYRMDGPLDMRMDRQAPLSAFDVVNSYEEREIARILREYGEERFAAQIARNICKVRKTAPIASTLQLSELVRESIPAPARREGGHPAKRSFQAIRMEVNDELGVLRRALDAALDLLNPGGRMAVITFHSLEDRMVKQAMQDWSRGCTCPRDFPVCICGNLPKARILGKKGIIPTKEEQERNKRAQSARLRCAEKA